jgi:hypothetical protein
MTTNGGIPKPFTAQFNETGPEVQLELINMTDHRLKAVEILTIFLKDEDSLGGPSRAHIKFAGIPSIQPKERIVMAHRTWIDGKPVDAAHDQLERLQALVEGGKRYVLDLSWEDPEGKSQFQRIPVGV